MKAYPEIIIFLFLIQIFLLKLVRAQSPNFGNPSLGSIHFGTLYKEARGSVTVDSLEAFSNQAFIKIPLTQSYKIQIYGFTGILENSFTLGYFAPQRNKRFRWGDHFLGQLSAGEEFSNLPGSISQIWGAYRFEIGTTAQYRIQNHFLLNANWNLLVYEKDVISPYVSGSSLSVGVLAYPIDFSANILARDSRIIGFIPALIHPSLNPHDFEFKLGYHFGAKNEIRVFTRWFNPPTFTYVDEYPEQNLQKNFSLQILYGHSF